MFDQDGSITISGYAMSFLNRGGYFIFDSDGRTVTLDPEAGAMRYSGQTFSFPSSSGTLATEGYVDSAVSGVNKHLFRHDIVLKETNSDKLTIIYVTCFKNSPTVISNVAYFIANYLPYDSEQASIGKDMLATGTFDDDRALDNRVVSIRGQRLRTSGIAMDIKCILSSGALSTHNVLTSNLSIAQDCVTQIF